MMPPRFILALGVMFFPLALCLPASNSACAQTGGSPAPQVRMKWQDFISGPNGEQRLASLEKAVAEMRSLDGSPSGSAYFRGSWKYWANIHGDLGSNSPFKT